MEKVFLFLTDGVEEIEAAGTIDVLRRAGIDVESVSLTEKKIVRGGHMIDITADKMFGEVDFSQALMLVIPGGTVAFNEHREMKRQIVLHAAQGKKIAAICAAPMVLGGLGLLQGKRATCYPGFEEYLDGALITEEAVVVDGNIITGRGPGFMFDFALRIVEILKGKESAKKVADGLLFKYI